MTCADDRYLTRFTILILPRSSTRRKASYHSAPEMHYFSIERKLPSLYCRINICSQCSAVLCAELLFISRSDGVCLLTGAIRILEDSVKCGGETVFSVHYMSLLDSRAVMTRYLFPPLQDDNLGFSRPHLIPVKNWRLSPLDRNGRWHPWIIVIITL